MLYWRLVNIGQVVSREPRLIAIDRLWHLFIYLLVARCYFSKSLRRLPRMGQGTRVLQGGNRSAIAL